MKKWISLALILALLAGTLAACGESGSAASAAVSGEEPAVSAEAAEASAAQPDGDMFTSRDLDPGYDESESVLIRLNGSSVSASSDSVQISGTTVTITEEAVYVISGTLDDGTILIDAPDTAKIQLVLDGASIHSETSAALFVRGADKVFVTLADGTENTLSNGGAFAAADDGENIDAALYSKQDLTLNGSGSLTVVSPAGHGVACSDDLVITGGSYSLSAASHALNANDSIRITGDVSLTAAAGKDGIHAENNDDDSLGFVYVESGEFSLEAEGDGVSAGAYLQILDGSFQILAGGGSENGGQQSSETWGRFPAGEFPGQSAEESADTASDSTSMKGVKAGGELLISGGSFTIDSADDGVHSNSSITVSGGSFEIAAGDDAFHADETLTVAAGTIRITESYEGLEALDIDIRGGDIALTAGDDGLNAAGGVDSSGSMGGRDGMFGGMGGG